MSARIVPRLLVLATSMSAVACASGGVKPLVAQIPASYPKVGDGQKALSALFQTSPVVLLDGDEIDVDVGDFARGEDHVFLRTAIHDREDCTIPVVSPGIAKINRKDIHDRCHIEWRPDLWQLMSPAAGGSVAGYLHARRETPVDRAQSRCRVAVRARLGAPGEARGEPFSAVCVDFIDEPKEPSTSTPCLVAKADKATTRLSQPRFTTLASHQPNVPDGSFLPAFELPARRPIFVVVMTPGDPCGLKNADHAVITLKGTDGISPPVFDPQQGASWTKLGGGWGSAGGSVDESGARFDFGPQLGPNVTLTVKLAPDKEKPKSDTIQILEVNRRGGAGGPLELTVTDTGAITSRFIVVGLRWKDNTPDPDYNKGWQVGLKDARHLVLTGSTFAREYATSVGTVLPAFHVGAVKQAPGKEIRITLDQADCKASKPPIELGKMIQVASLPDATRANGTWKVGAVDGCSVVLEGSKFAAEHTATAEDDAAIAVRPDDVAEGRAKERVMLKGVALTVDDGGSKADDDKGSGGDDKPSYTRTYTVETLYRGALRVGLAGSFAPLAKDLVVVTTASGQHYAQLASWNGAPGFELVAGYSFTFWTSNQGWWRAGGGGEMSDLHPGHGVGLNAALGTFKVGAGGLTGLSSLRIGLEYAYGLDVSVVLPSVGLVRHDVPSSGFQAGQILPNGATSIGTTFGVTLGLGVVVNLPSSIFRPLNLQAGG